MNRTITLLYCSITLLLHQPLYAAFEPLGCGGRAKAMGGTFTAIADDASSAYWNPAGLGFIKSKELAVSYEDLFDLGLVRYNTLSYTHPGVGQGAAGFSLLRLETIGDADFLDYAENTYLFSYGQPIFPYLSLGANMRYYSVSYEKKASGVGFDAGFLYKVFKDKLVLGGAIQDFNEPLIRWETEFRERLPWTMRGGISSKWRWGLVACEYERRRREDSSFHVGTEYNIYKKVITLRAGGVSRQDWHSSFGVGINFNRIVIDLSWLQNQELGNTQNFSFLFKF